MDLINTSERNWDDSPVEIPPEVVQTIIAGIGRLQHEQFNNTTTVIPTLTFDNLLLNHTASNSDYPNEVLSEFPRVELGAALDSHQAPSDCDIGLPKTNLNRVVYNSDVREYVEENSTEICPTRNNFGSGIEENSTITAIRIQLQQQRDKLLLLQKNIIGLNGQAKQRYETILEFPKQRNTEHEFHRLNVPTIDQQLQLPRQTEVDQVTTSEQSDVTHSEIAETISTSNNRGSGVEENSTITAIRIQLQQQLDKFLALRKNILGLNGQATQRYETILEFPKQLNTEHDFHRLNVPTINQQLQLQLPLQTEVNEVPTYEQSDGTQSEIAETITMNQLSPLWYSGRMEQLPEIETVHSSTGDSTRSEDDVSLDAELNGKSEEVVRSEHPTASYEEDSFNQSEDSLRMKQVCSDLMRKGETETSAENPRNSPKKSKIHTCGECKKEFNWKSNLIVHLRIHSGEMPYKCEDCNSVFRQSTHLRSHQRIHTGERPYKCKDCSSAFSQLTHLKIHQRIHSGERPYKCKECNSAFSNASNLRSHERVHSGERPYKCKECNSAFSDASNLKSHERVHSGERPYMCKECNSTFSDVGNLKRHQRIHSGERPYKCEECNSDFSHSSNLKRHQRIHSDKKPFVCNICKKSFRRKSILAIHMGIHVREQLMLRYS